MQLQMQFHMDRIKITTAILFILMLTLSSCIRDVIMDAKEKPQVVVVCVLSDDPVQTLQLSFTKGASLAEAPALTEAVAMLYDGTKAVGEFKRGSDGIWRLEYAAIPGHTYRLEVQVPGYDMIRGTRHRTSVNLRPYHIDPHQGTRIYSKG